MASSSGLQTSVHAQEDVPSSETSQPNISPVFLECLQLHKILLALLQEGPARSDDADLEEALNVYGRLRIWGEETRAILSPSSRGSLDDSLRKDLKLKSVATRILQRLKRKVELGRWREVAGC